ncbi:hypothetical protein [Mesorhizobium retamae]|uniref:HD/PDEase domain-containing protein n=1 Tax=Mesorhizobium retamae TaxID=2912854 RepID=A0ABS9QHV6_9HYPH|nr:hypothetical protein [Mesorhizobium sp. IRAMC:0171]MCG7507037.1 hypothetical protein [Mesorhizobium sp. IRAMC:0171]
MITDNLARQHVEHNPDDLATAAFGPLHMYGIHECERELVIPLALGRRLPVGANDNATIPTTDVCQVAGAATERNSYKNPRSVNITDWAKPKDRGPYITTYTGRFYFNDPRPEDFEIEDIAHSLAMTRRYSGHGRREYTTAEHSVHVYRWLVAQAASLDTRLAGLVHDAPEPLSGFNDVASPRKKTCSAIAAAESLIWRKAIAPKFDLPEHIPGAVHEADKRICHDEMTQNLWEVDPNVGPPLGVELEFWPFERARAEFLRAFYEVQRQRQEQARAAA